MTKKFLATVFASILLFALSAVVMAQDDEDTAADADLQALTLDAGEVSVVVAKMDDKFKVGTPSGVVAVRGTKFVVGVAGDGKGTVHVLEGKVSFLNEAGEVLLEVGKMIEFAKGVIPQLQDFDLGKYQEILNLWEGGITKGEVRDFIKGKVKEKVKEEVKNKLKAF